MYLGEPQTIQQLHEWLSSEWTSSPLSWASSEEGIRFLGLEIYKVKSGYRMCQLGYIKELLRHHGLSEGPGARTPCPREWLLGDGEIEQTTYDERSLRKAQQMTGELLWLSTKSRPDLMHSVASMSSLCLRDPILVERIGSRVLAYLHTTAHLSLMFGTAGADGPHDVIAYSDASFSPSGGRSIGCSLVTYHGNAAAWRSGRQSLVALSTAEAELIEAVASVQLQAGIAALTCEINLVPIRRALYVDNSASVGLCTDSPGTWRLYDLRNMWGLIKYEEAEGQQSGKEDRANKDASAFRLRLCGAQALLKVLVVLYCVTQPVAGKKAKPDIEVTFPWELYGLVFLLVIAGIAVWEVVKKIWSRLQPDESESREARRLRKLQSAVREELQGIGLASPTPATTSSSSSARAAPAPTYTSGGFDSYLPPPAPYPTGDDLPPLEELRGSRRRRCRDQGVQTEPRRIQGETTIQYSTPLFITKSGKCIHARDTCSSLVVGGRTEQRFLCQLCNRG
ncbi:GIP [Symbiodinium necroappetens]|uniref:GIP protein n=1 Tax=Symbiodinium necroappetens TaxID=1628268 RepID=A0A813AC93_9DINO|nr:GIP [Symbiodinium necroappetens]